MVFAKQLTIRTSIAALAIVASSCLHDNPTSPSQSAVTDTFTGSLKPQGSVIFTFTVATNGLVEVTLKNITPSTSAAVGLGIGTASSNGCTVTQSTSSVIAASTAQISVAEPAGSYCVKVYDTGNLIESATVTVTVAHP